jgi:hypothetical protein
VALKRMMAAMVERFRDSFDDVQRRIVLDIHHANDRVPVLYPYRRFTAASRATAHGSGPVWFATPSPHWTSTTYSLPVSWRTLTQL